MEDMGQDMSYHGLDFNFNIRKKGESMCHNVKEAIRVMVRMFSLVGKNTIVEELEPSVFSSLGPLNHVR